MRLLLLLFALALPSFAAAEPLDYRNWEFPQLEETYASAFALAAAAEDLPTTAAQAMLSATYLAADDHADRLQPLFAAAILDLAIEIPEEDLIEIQALAQSVSTLTARRWGSEPLLRVALDDLRGDELFQFLLDQFRDDEVPHNSYGAARIWLLGQSAMPKRFLQHAAAEWRETQAGSRPLDQKSIRVGQAILDHAAAAGDSCDDDTQLANWSLLDPDLQQVALQVVGRTMIDECWQIGWEMYELRGYALRPQALRILNLAEPFPGEAVAGILRAEEIDRRDFLRVFELTLNRRPSFFLHPGNEPLFVRGLLLSNIWGSVATDVGHILSDDPTVHHMESLSLTETAVEELQSVRIPLLRIVHRAMNEAHDGVDQMKLARVLVLAGFEVARDDVLRIAISNFADDHEYLNRSLGLEVLWEVASESDGDIILAGVRAGVELRDWQLTTSALEMFRNVGGEFDPASDDELMLFLIDSLADDDVGGNGAAAYAALLAAGEGAEPWLQAVLDSDASDWQQRQAARRLLNGNPYLGE